MFVRGINDADYVEVPSGHTTEICLGQWEVYSEIGLAMPRSCNTVATPVNKWYLRTPVSAQTTATHARQLCVMLLLEFSTVRARARTTAQTRANFKKNWRLALSLFV